MRTVVEIANLYLQRIIPQVQRPWDEWVVNVLGDIDGPKAVAKIRTKTAGSWEGIEPYGTYLGSTSSLRKICPEVLPSQESDVWDLLKNNFRIVQVGKGKGSALVLPLGNAPLEDYYEPIHADPLESIARLHLLLQDREILSYQLTKIQKRNEELEFELKSLKSQASISYRTTWS